MALYGSLGEQDPAPAAAVELSRGHLRQVGGLAEALGLVLAGLLLMCWLVGAYAGLVYWSVQSSLWGVILSVIVPGFGVASTLPLYVWLGSSS